MNPLQAKKVDIKSLTPEEQRLFRLYGKLPSRSDHFAKHLKERKYFDSGDYAMNKAGKGDSVDTGAVGSQHPLPENIPHLSSPVSGPNGIGSMLHPHHHHQHHASMMQAGSPVKESSFLNQETSAEDVENAAAGTGAEDQQQPAGDAEGITAPAVPAEQQAIPLRQ